MPVRAARVAWTEEAADGAPVIGGQHAVDVAGKRR
jgi:hypothetical protein